MWVVSLDAGIRKKMKDLKSFNLRKLRKIKLILKQTEE